MAFAWVQNKSVGVNPSSSIAVTMNSSMTATNLAVVNIKLNSITNTISSVTDDKGNTYIASGSPVVANSFTVVQYYGVQTTGGTTTVTVTLGSSGPARAEVDEFSGNATSGVFDVYNTNSGNSATASTTLSPANNGELIVACMVNTGGVTPSSGTVYALTSTSSSNLGVEYKLSGTTSETPSFTLTSNPWVIAASAYKVPGTSTVTSPTSLLMGIG